MRSLTKGIILFLTLAFIFIGCEKLPKQEINDAKAAVTAATKESANKYAKEEIKKLKADLKVALNEVDSQSKKFFKDYGKVKELLSNVKADAETLKNVTIPKQREEAKKKKRTAKK